MLSATDPLVTREYAVLARTRANRLVNKAHDPDVQELAKLVRILADSVESLVDSDAVPGPHRFR
ncbi:MAG: hypothetical protein WAX29_03755 [Propionibacterium sp.]